MSHEQRSGITLRVNGKSPLMAAVRQFCRVCAIRAGEALVIIGIVIGVTWMTAKAAKSAEVQLGAGTGVIHSSDKTFLLVSTSIPNYSPVLVNFGKWNDNTVFTVGYDFRWDHLHAMLGGGVVSNETDTVKQTGVAHFTVGVRPLKWLQIDVDHWSSPARDKGENAATVKFVTTW